jgi:N-methylhydantoinase A
VELVGGGGGAAALVPYAARALGLHHRLARNAEVISPLGVALALVRDVVERTIVDPTPEDLARIRREAVDAAIRSGAAPERVEVTLDVDRARNLVRAVASGATALVEGAAARDVASDDDRLAAAARALHATDAVTIVVRTPRFAIVAGSRALAVVDERAVVRVVAPRGVAFATTAGTLARTLAAAIEEHTTSGDVGRAPPDVWLLVGARAIELVGIADAEAAAALTRDEIAGLAPDEPLALVAIPQRV